MRGVVQSFGVVALLVPACAQAEACPAEIGPKFERSLGQARAWLDDDEPVYQPSGVEKLGSRVSYVIVDRALRWNGKTYDNVGIARVRYRLEGVQRTFEGAYPAPARAAFDEAYPGSECGAGGASGCSAALSPPAGLGGLFGAALDGGALTLREKAYGPGLDLVRADYELDSVPGFLVCEYQVAP